jgi:hypothetical protein
VNPYDLGSVAQALSEVAKKSQAKKLVRIWPGGPYNPGDSRLVTRAEADRHLEQLRTKPR